MVPPGRRAETHLFPPHGKTHLISPVLAIMPSRAVPRSLLKRGNEASQGDKEARAHGTTKLNQSLDTMDKVYGVVG